MSAWRAKLEALYWKGIAAVQPEECVARAIRYHEGDLEWVESGRCTSQFPLPVLVLGAGKAAARMARGLATVLPPQQYHGAVVTSTGNETCVPGIDVLLGSHPIPNEESLFAAEKLLALASSGAERAAVFLLSGGASSLLAAPWPPVSLEDKIATTRLLLTSGASIQEVNTVRKHISRVKGGRLLQLLQRPVLTLALSDVVGDDPATIGSGPTVPDPTTFADAQAVLHKYDLWRAVPESVRAVITAGLAGQIPETLKPSAPESRFVHYRIVAGNWDARRACAEAARSNNWHVELIEQPVVGEARQAAANFADRIRQARRSVGSHPHCIIAGGETTVTVRGEGLGGRNQEFALALAPLLDGLPVSALIASTDGIDGPTNAAGAFVDGTTMARAKAHGLDAARYLERNDSYHFFAALGDLFVTGPTGTNVMDLQLAVLYP